MIFPRSVSLCGLVLSVLPLSCGLRAAMVPFTMPADDLSGGQTDAAFLQFAPAGAQGWIHSTEDGHLADNAGRVRFWGVNIVASDNFPSKGNADLIAPRLARFGFNCVRFHHLDQPWASPSLINYDSGNSRSFNTASLDALHYLSAKLKAEGIYWDYNLHVARNFLAADGLPSAIDSMTWAQKKGLVFWQPAMLALQKEYAQKLLTTVNPYTGLAPVDDPALAIVEITNENGLAQAWLGNEMAGWPAVFRSDFQTLWNAWLSTRYGTDEAMNSAWGVVTEPLGSERLTNGSFSGTTGWYLENHGTAASTLTTGTYSGRQAARINVTTTSAESWHVQLAQAGLALDAGQVYTVSCWLRADSARNVYLAVGQAHDPWQTISVLNCALTSSWQYFEFSVQPAEADSNMRVLLGGMGGTTGSVYLSTVSLKPGGTNNNMPAGVTLASGTIPILDYGSAYLSTQKLDWMRFLVETESSYWTGMRQYIREDLGYRGLIVGTINSTSTPNMQAQMDACDSHTYWQHPVFPNNDWSSTNWTVNNVSMLNERGGVLAGLAAQRVEGKPFFVTEYQHPSPNTYSSEAPLMLAAYAAFQDWDGVFFFQYGNGIDAWNRGYFNGFFDIDQHPAKLANALAGAFLFRRGDVAAASSTTLMKLDPETEMHALAEGAYSWSLVNANTLGLDSAEALVHRVGVSVGANATGLTTPPAAQPDSAPFASDTGELIWDRTDPAAGRLVIDTPRSKAYLGFTDGKAVSFSGGILLTPGTTVQGWSTISLTAMQGDAQTLEYGTRLVVATTGDIANTNMVWTSAARVSVSDKWGTSPTLVEQIPATLVLPVTADHVRFYSLDARGRRVLSLPVAAGSATDTCSLALGTEETLWYEIEIVPGAAYDTWAAEYFASAQLSDPSVSGADADPDGDGNSNWAEYAFGTDPLAWDSPFAPGAAHVTVDGVAKLAVYVKSAGRTDAALHAEYSSDLANWQAITLESAADANNANLLRVLMPDSGQPVFVRVTAK